MGRLPSGFRDLKNAHSDSNLQEESSTDAAEGPSLEKDAAAEDSTGPTDDRMCRICFAGSEEADVLGRLISPCLCKGTIRYVHVECLNTWRLSSQKKTSFFQCDECKYKYAFRRTAIAKYASNECVLTLVTLVLFAFCVFVGGFLAKLFIYMSDGSLTALSMPVEEDSDVEPLTFSGIFHVDFMHVLLGVFFVGIVGLLQIVFSLMWLGPFPSYSLRLPNGGGSGSGRGDSFAAIMFGIMLLIGIIKAIWGMYKLVRGVSRLILERVELKILEVNES